MEVQTLVEQVREKTANIQALAHSTVGQSLPVRVQPLGGNLGWHLQQGLPGDLLLFLFLSPDPSEETLPLHHQYQVATAFLRI